MSEENFFSTSTQLSPSSLVDGKHIAIYIIAVVLCTVLFLVGVCWYLSYRRHSNRHRSPVLPTTTTPRIVHAVPEAPVHPSNDEAIQPLIPASPEVMTPPCDLVLDDLPDDHRKSIRISRAQRYKQTGITLEPTELLFNTNIINERQTVQLINTLNYRVVIKARCSDNTQYRINPVYAFIEPQSSIEIQVNRYGDKDGPDKIIFNYAKADGQDMDAGSYFNKRKVYPSLLLPLCLTNEVNL